MYLSTWSTVLDPNPDIYIFPDGYSQRADAAAELALESETVAREASDTISDIVEQLPDDRARVDQISVDILQVNADILRAQESGMMSTF